MTSLLMIREYSIVLLLRAINMLEEDRTFLLIRKLCWVSIINESQFLQQLHLKKERLPFSSSKCPVYYRDDKTSIKILQPQSTWLLVPVLHSLVSSLKTHFLCGFQWRTAFKIIFSFLHLVEKVFNLWQGFHKRISLQRQYRS